MKLDNAPFYPTVAIILVAVLVAYADLRLTALLLGLAVVNLLLWITLALADIRRALLKTATKDQTIVQQPRSVTTEDDIV